MFGFVTHESDQKSTHIFTASSKVVFQKYHKIKRNLYVFKILKYTRFTCFVTLFKLKLMLLFLIFRDLKIYRKIGIYSILRKRLVKYEVKFNLVKFMALLNLL